MLKLYLKRECLFCTVVKHPFRISDNTTSSGYVDAINNMLE